jgi:hypothetical protein
MWFSRPNYKCGSGESRLGGNFVKRLSRIALAVTVALSLTAAIGSASASAATVLCKTHKTTVCPAEDILPAGSYQTFGGEMTLTSTTTGAKFACYPIGFAAKTTAERGTPLPATGEYALFTAGCNVSGSSCTSISIPNTEDQLHMSGGGGWTIGSSSAPLIITLHCFGVTCQYSATSAVEMSVPYEGKVPGEEASITKAPMTRTYGGFLCPGGTSFTLNYEGWLQTESYLAYDS